MIAFRGCLNLSFMISNLKDLFKLVAYFVFFFFVLAFFWLFLQGGGNVGKNKNTVIHFGKGIDFDIGHCWVHILISHPPISFLTFKKLLVTLPWASVFSVINEDIFLWRTLQGIGELVYVVHLAQCLAYWYLINSVPFLPPITMVMIVATK